MGCWRAKRECCLPLVKKGGGLREESRRTGSGVCAAVSRSRGTDLQVRKLMYAVLRLALRSDPKDVFESRLKVGLS